MATWIALLRGVNVGGANKLPMSDLRASVASLGYENVSTYIQSGNILFECAEPEARIVATLQRVIEERHGMTVPIIARTLPEMREALTRHPDAGGDIEPKLLHIAFLDRAPDRPSAVDAGMWLPDRWSLRGRELFLTYPNGSARSKMTIDRFEKLWDVAATARNLNTVAKLVDLATAP